MKLEGTVGPQVLSEGGLSEVRLGRTRELVTVDAHARSHEATSRGLTYHAAIQASAALGTALTASAATLTLYNPVGSGVLLSVLHVSAAILTAPAGGAALVYAVNTNPTAAPPTGTTAATVRSNRLGPSTGKGVAYTVATLPAVPTIARILSNLSTNVSAQQILDDVNGLLLLPENTALTIQNVGAAASGLVAISWEEVPA